MQYGENDPRHHTAKLTAEVLLGLGKAYQDFEDRHERAWKGAAG
jgi:hypothetical protein